MHKLSRIHFDSTQHKGGSMVVVYPLCQDFSRKCHVFKFKIEEYLQSRYSLGANKTSTSTKGVYGNNIPSVLTFS